VKVKPKAGIRTLASLLLVSLVFVSTASVGKPTAAFQPVFAAQIAEDTNGRKHVSGEYVNSMAGFSIRFPDHWSGVEEFNGTITWIYPDFDSVLKNPKEFTGVMISSVSKTFAKDIFQKLLSSPEIDLAIKEMEGGEGEVMPEEDQECRSREHLFTEVNEVELFRAVSECPISFSSSRTDICLLPTNTLS